MSSSARSFGWHIECFHNPFSLSLSSPFLFFNDPLAFVRRCCSEIDTATGVAVWTGNGGRKRRIEDAMAEGGRKEEIEG